MEPSIMLWFSVTAPMLASKRPCTVAGSSRLIESCASTLPMNDVVVPSVAELPTCQ